MPQTTGKNAWSVFKFFEHTGFSQCWNLQNESLGILFLWKRWISAKKVGEKFLDNHSHTFFSQSKYKKIPIVNVSKNNVLEGIKVWELKKKPLEILLRRQLCSGCRVDCPAAACTYNSLPIIHCAIGGFFKPERTLPQGLAGPQVGASWHFSFQAAALSQASEPPLTVGLL